MLFIMWVGGNQGAFFKTRFGNSICARFENDWVEMNSKRERGRHALTCPMQLESVLLANLTKTHQARRELSAYQVERWNEFYHLLTKMTIQMSSFIWLINVMWEGTAAGPWPLLADLPARWQRGRTWGEDAMSWRERQVALRAHLRGTEGSMSLKDSRIEFQSHL